MASSSAKSCSNPSTVQVVFGTSVVNERIQEHAEEFEVAISSANRLVVTRRSCVANVPLAPYGGRVKRSVW
jgi:hypothetical protein